MKPSKNKPKNKPPKGKLLAPVAKAIKKKQPKKKLDKLGMPSVFEGTGISAIANLGYN